MLAMIQTGMLLLLLTSLSVDQIDAAIQTELDNLKAPEASIRARAAYSLAQGKNRSADIIRALRNHLQDPDDSVRLEVSVALLRLDQSQSKEPLAALVQLLRQEKTSTPLEVLLRCRDLEPVSPELIEKAIHLAGENRSALQTFGLLLLDNLGPSSREGAPLLEAALKTSPQPIRLRVASALARMDVKYQEESLAVLKEGLQQPNDANRFLAARLLVNLDPTQEGARQRIQAELTSRDPDRRHDAVEILGSMGPAAKEAGADLRKRLADEEPEVALTAVESLIRIFPERSREFLPTLIRMRDPEDKQGSAKMLALIDQLYQLTEESSPSQVVRMMAEQLRRPARNLPEQLRRLDAVTRLVQLGSRAQPARMDLVRALDDHSPLIRSQALWALKRMGPDKTNPQDMRLVQHRMESISGDSSQPSDIRKAAQEVLQIYRAKN